MLLIPCPAVRAQIEFAYGGDASVTRPLPEAPMQAWIDFVYRRENPAGPHDELWHHSAGCRQWLRVRRDTRTNVILESGPPRSGGAR